MTFTDPAGFEQSLDGGVKRRRADRDFAIGKFTRLLHDGVAMLVAVGECEQDKEGRGGKRKIGAIHGLYISSDDISCQERNTALSAPFIEAESPPQLQHEMCHQFDADESET